MNITILALFLAWFSSTSKPATLYEPVAVVELFTSQGCSSCPKADELLAQTRASAEKEDRNIYTLSFHVDYWNRLGWEDPFSNEKYSDRQRDYAVQLNPGHIYTPQMIVNGSTEFVGSDKYTLLTAVNEALKTNAKAGFKILKVTRLPSKSIRVDYEIEGNYSDSKICLALVSSKEVTSVKRGENSGRTLTNENVVRQFLSVVASPRGEVEFSSTSIPAAGNGTVIAFLQRRDDLRIIGATAVNVL